MSDQQHFYRKVKEQRDPNQTPEMKASGLLSRVLSDPIATAKNLRGDDYREFAAVLGGVRDCVRNILQGTGFAESFPREFEGAPEDILLRQLKLYKDDFLHRSKFKAFRIPSDYNRERQGSPHRQLNWEDIQKRLFANDFELLRKSLKLQGGGMLIGVLDDGRICLQDRGRVPVIYAFDKKGEEKIIMRNGYSPDAFAKRESELDEIEQKGGRFANEQEIRERVARDGLVLPTWRNDGWGGGPCALLNAAWASDQNEGDRINDPHIIDDVYRNHRLECEYAVVAAAGREDEEISVLSSDRGYPIVPREKKKPARNLGAVRFLIG